MALCRKGELVQVKEIREKSTVTVQVRLLARIIRRQKLNDEENSFLFPKHVYVQGSFGQEPAPQPTSRNSYVLAGTASPRGTANSPIM